MAKITISAEYLGDAIKVVRSQNVSATRMAHLLGCSVKQLHIYEEGLDLIPRNVLWRVFKYAVMTDAMIDK